MTTSILVTKLFIPPTRPGLVHRTNLIKRLNDGLNGKLSLISAPAGFGKTTLVSEWVQAIGETIPPIAIAWLSLDERENDPTRFLVYLIAALRTIEPDIALGALSALQSPQPPPAEDILISLINEIAAIPDRIIIVLDDYHLIEAQPIHDAITFLLENLPTHLYLVIATREDPPLSLARLRARGQLNELRATDLRFTSAEAAEFLNQVMGLDLSAEDIVKLETRTEGWIAGLQLAAISMQGHDDAASLIKSFTGSHRLVLDYLIEEVLEQQTESVQTFLLQTSILNRLTGSLCDAVRFGTTETPSSSEGTAITGQDNGQQTLEYLERANLFIVPLDNERRWYRYHHLFADLLRQRLHQSYPEQISVLQLRASQWYERSGFADEAIEYALRAEDFVRAADLIEESVDAVWQRAEQTKLYRWLNALPVELVFAKPHLCVLHAWCHFVIGQHNATEDCLQAAERVLQTNTERKIEVMKHQGRISALRAFMATYHGNLPEMIQYARQALADLPEKELFWRIVASIALADALLHQGNYLEAFKARVKTMETSYETGNVYLILTSSLRVAISLREQGKLQRVVEICQQQLNLATQSGFLQTGTVGWLLAIWGEALAEMNNLESALEKTRKGVALAERGGDVAILGWCNLCLMRILFSKGDIAGVENIIQKSENLVRQHIPPPWMTSMTGAWQAWIWLIQDNMNAASQWALEHEIIGDNEPTHPNEFEYRMLARVLIAQGRIEDADLLLHQLHEFAQKGRTTNSIEILILQALAFQLRGDSDGAVDTLQKALTLAEPLGFFRIFVDEGPPMARLLYETLSRGIAPEYVQRLLAAFPIDKPKQAFPSQAHPQKSELVEPLSEREIEVLQLIAKGLTNPEIASRLYLSLNTVKVHTRNIYGKLGVNNRAQAAARARALGILPST